MNITLISCFVLLIYLSERRIFIHKSKGNPSSRLQYPSDLLQGYTEIIEEADCSYQEDYIEPTAPAQRTGAASSSVLYALC